MIDLQIDFEIDFEIDFVIDQEIDFDIELLIVSSTTEKSLLLADLAFHTNIPCYLFMRIFCHDTPPTEKSRPYMDKV